MKNIYDIQEAIEKLTKLIEKYDANGTAGDDRGNHIYLAMNHLKKAGEEIGEAIQNMNDDADAEREADAAEAIAEINNRENERAKKHGGLGSQLVKIAKGEK